MNDLLAGLAARVATDPDGIALEGSNEEVTASELDAAVRTIAHTLQAANVERVGLLAENGPAWIITDLACQMADICLVPLPSFFSDTQLANSIERASIDTLLTDDEGRLRRIVPCHDVQFKSAAVRTLTMLGVVPTQRHALPDGTRKITFTSGSTGTPKGVCLDTAQQVRVAQALSTAIGIQTPRHLCLLPLSTLLENIGGVYVPLLTGGTVIAPPGADIGLVGSAGLDIPRMLRALERHQPTSIILLPQMLVGLVAALEDGWTPPTSLEFVAVGGGKVSPSLIHLARGAGLPVYEGYGLSETASVACLNHPDHDLPGSVGQPLAHVELEIDDDEIIVRGNTFLGYLDDPSTWSPESVSTGDLGHMDEEGFVHISGRRKNVLISSFGRNINPEWIESQLLSHPLLAQCFVFGDAQPWCVALVATSDPATADHDIDEWVDHVNSSLPDYARVRGWYLLNEKLTTRNGLITDNGRPRRLRIAQHYASIIASLYPAQPKVEAL